MVDLWRAYHETPNANLRQQLIEQYAPLARYVVDRLNYQPASGVSYDDLLGQAIIGLIEAIDRYDPARGVKFNTYAYYRIRGSVMDMLRNMDWMPRSLRVRSNEVLQVMTHLSHALGRTPTDEEIANAMGISMKEYDEVAQEVGGQSIVSLDETWNGGSADGSLTMLDTLADEQMVSPVHFVEEQDQRRLLTEAIANLPDTEKMVIALYYQDGLTLKEIGKVLSVTESRVCQIHARAVLRLRAAMKN